LERVVEGQIRKGVQALEVMRGAVRDAERRVRERTGSADGEEMEEPELGDYLEALLDGVELQWWLVDAFAMTFAI
jgi:hypothetical protein